ncbi:hypothetical protein F0562_032601 [Nyssa sinensis]|uniref:Uncharacterized protein n=1 Tax=Nyssa sinensis TaxID=561372 RepID=A0A5J5ANK3_9ASTE|nr:hypothetical protein F0562_032601 [Nyssa sinensis]
MGNSLGGKKTAKVMKINGETLKFKTPVQAGEVVKDYPGHVLLESEAVKHFGIRAKPLEVQQELKPKRLYFLVELPKFPEEKGARRVRSGIHMSAKDRLESLMLAKRSVSDLSAMKPNSILLEESTEAGPVRLKMRLPKAEVAKLMMGSKDEAEAAEKIVDFCIANGGGDRGGAPSKGNEGSLLHKQVHWKGGHGNVKEGFNANKKRVGFLPVNEGEIQLAAAS